MVNSLSVDYEDIHKLNLNLLDMVKQGKWEEFIELAEVYISSLQNVIEKRPVEMIQEDKKNLRVIITSLIENEEEITRVLKNRLDVLRKDMSSLHRGNKCSRAYSSQYTSAFH